MKIVILAHITPGHIEVSYPEHYEKVYKEIRYFTLRQLILTISVGQEPFG